MLAFDPGYPVYKTSTLFVEGKCYNMPFLEENNFLPDYDALPKDVVAGAKLMFIGYPNNPTGAVAPMTFFNETVEFAKNNDIIVVHDDAHSKISYDGYKAPSFLQASGAMDVGIETYSLPKTYNMTGVNSVKTVHKTFINVDAGFALLIRPAMYDSWHEVTMASKADAPAEITATVTPNLRDRRHSCSRPETPGDRDR